MSKVLERFLNYVSYHTTSEDDQETVPSTDRQWILAKALEQELKTLGATNVRMSEHCYVYATIPATTTKKVPALGFVAHMDTAPALTAENAKPRVVKNYDGGDIVLNEALGIVMSPKQFPKLKNNEGEDLVVTDGTTLLGGDDKAGIAEIMTMAEYLLTHPEIEHGTIQIGFTPDEEVGRGVDFFDVEGFGADFAYTVDGSTLGEIEYENFNAAGAKLRIQGTSIHPGYAKGKMKNAVLLGMEFHQMLPVSENPAYTEGYEGFYHLDKIEGTVDSATLYYIIRDHDKVKFEEKKKLFSRVCEFLNEKYGKDTFSVEIKDNYYNMKEKVEPHMHLVDRAKEAMEALEITPAIVPIRGGTDGARLSFMGLPCPNLCTGGENYHGRYEYVSVNAMEKVVELLIKIIELYAK
ncbi:peptidase T [Lachnoclostridium sp.]|uniref:peptidase T n=1 Tax=Lachnoclostridium sp. TaxID=2028282 RepID=UPI00289CED82|nr:peptidase T [Lachnoclostridium sp.]